MAGSPRRFAALLMASCLAVDVALAACAETGGRAPVPSGSPGAPTVGAPTSTSPTATGPTAAGPTTASVTPPSASGDAAAGVPQPGSPTTDRITLAFAGDVHFERGVADLLSDPAPLTASVRDTLGRADFAMVNLETAVGSGGAPLPGKQYTFRAPVSSLTTLAGVGVDAVSMANNHAADFGSTVFAQTLAARSGAPIPVVGVGRDESEAFTPLRVDVRGVRVAVLASSQISDVTSREYAAGPATAGIATNLDPGRLRRAVRAAAKTSDLVVVMLHWGTQYTRCADPRQRATAALLAADGADVIVGGHAHRPQGGGWFGPDDVAYVAYGLGNFVWYNNEGASAETGVLTLTVDAAAARHRTHPPGARTSSVVLGEAWSPMLIGGDGVPRPAPSGASRERLVAAWDTATTCAGLDGSPG